VKSILKIKNYNNQLFSSTFKTTTKKTNFVLINILNRLMLISVLVLSTNIHSEQTTQTEERRPPISFPDPDPSIYETDKLLQQTPWSFLQNYQAKYAVRSEGDTLGHATRKLNFKDQQWTLSTSAKISKFFLSVKTNETTSFHIKDDLLINDHFYSRTKISLKKARVMEQTFDWDKKVEIGKRGKKSWELPLEKQVFDRISNVIQLRADLLAGKTVFNYDVSYKGKAYVYSYTLVKKETLKTKMGEISTMKFLREKSNGDQVVLWLAPEFNYIPFKIAQYEKDEADATLVLESLEYLSDKPTTERSQGQ